MQAIYTIGTSTRRPEDFIALLRRFAIRRLVDVRRYPVSRWEHFGRDELAALCEVHEITYCWLGDRLGGERTGGYEAYMETAAFGEGIAAVERLAARETIALCCAERTPWRCHRWWIAGELVCRGWEVRHIIDADEVMVHTQLPL